MDWIEFVELNKKINWFPFYLRIFLFFSLNQSTFQSWAKYFKLFKYFFKYFKIINTKLCH